jgi:transcriptional regulator with XRE-family HTH domain
MSTSTHRRNFAHCLRRLRAEARLSQAGLAAASGVPVGTIRGYEISRSEPGFSALLLLARGLNVGLAAFEMDPRPRRKPRRRGRKGGMS